MKWAQGKEPEGKWKENSTAWLLLFNHHISGGGKECDSCVLGGFRDRNVKWEKQDILLFLNSAVIV